MNSNLEIRSQYPVLKVPGSRPAAFAAQGYTLSAILPPVKNFFQVSFFGGRRRVHREDSLYILRASATAVKNFFQVFGKNFSLAAIVLRFNQHGSGAIIVIHLRWHEARQMPSPFSLNRLDATIIPRLRAECLIRK